MSEENNELNVLNSDQELVRKRSFGDGALKGEINLGLLHKIVRWQRAGWRAGTHSVLTRALASGGGRKPWKQKGTGNARAGSNTSPVWVGGGVAHGPKPRSYEFSLNKQERRLGLLHAMRARFAEGRMIVIDKLELPELKTKAAAALLAKYCPNEKGTVLVVVGEENKNLEICFRNLPFVKFVTPEGLNVYDILCRKYLLITDEALTGVEIRLGLDKIEFIDGIETVEQ